MTNSHNHYMKLIHIAKRDLQLVDEDYRRIIIEKGGSASGSAKDLTDRGANLVLDHFKTLGWIPSKIGGQTLPGLKSRRVGMATQKQLAMLLKLWSIAARTPTEAAFNHFLKNRFGISHYRFLSMHKVSGIKVALETMKKKRQVEDVLASNSPKSRSLKYQG